MCIPGTSEILFTSLAANDEAKETKTSKLNNDMSVNPISHSSNFQPSEINSEEECFFYLPILVMEKIFSYLNSNDYKNFINAHPKLKQRTHLEMVGSGIQDILLKNDYCNYLRASSDTLNNLLFKENISPDDCKVIFDFLKEAAIHGDINNVQKILTSGIQEIEPFKGNFNSSAYEIKFYQFDWKPLQEVIVLAAKCKRSSIVKELMTCKWYRDTCSSYNQKDYRVEKALIQAVMHGCEQTVKVISQHGQDVISDEALIQAIVSTAGRVSHYSSSAYVNIKEFLIEGAKKRNLESSRYENIIQNVSGALMAAVQDGLLEIASNIIDSSEFDKIDVEVLNKIWNIVCKEKHVDLAMKLIKSPKFPQIKLFYCWIYDRYTLFPENRSAIQALIASERFGSLSSDDLNILCQANFLLLEELIKCSRFKDIGKTALGKALIKAAENSTEALKALVDSSRFNEIEKEDLENALLKSLEYGYYKKECSYKNILMLIKNPRFKDIGKTALGEALIKAAENSVEALKTLVDSPGFNKISFAQEKTELGNKPQERQRQVIKPSLGLLLDIYSKKNVYQSDKDHSILQQFLKHKDIYQLQDGLVQKILYQLIAESAWDPLKIILKALKERSLFGIKDEDLKKIQSYVTKAVNENVNKKALKAIIAQCFETNH